MLERLEIQENFIADIQAEVVMNEVPPALIFNWDQTALHLVTTGQWTMNRAGEKSFQSNIAMTSVKSLLFSLLP